MPKRCNTHKKQNMKNGQVEKYAIYFANMNENFVDKYNNTLAHFAVQCAQEYFARVPTSLYFVPNIHGMTPVLQLCCYDKHVQILQRVPFDVAKLRDAKKRTALMLAVKLDQRKMIQFLLQCCKEQQCTVDAILVNRDRYFRSVLQFACSKACKLPILEVLLDALHDGSNDVKQIFGDNLFYAAKIFYKAAHHSPMLVMALLYNKYKWDPSMLVQCCCRYMEQPPLVALHKLGYQFTSADMKSVVVTGFRPAVDYVHRMSGIPIQLEDVITAIERYHALSMHDLLTKEQKEQVAHHLYCKCIYYADFCHLVNCQFPLSSMVAHSKWESKLKQVYYHHTLMHVAAFRMDIAFSKCAYIFCGDKFVPISTVEFGEVAMFAKVVDFVLTMFEFAQTRPMYSTDVTTLF